MISATDEQAQRLKAMTSTTPPRVVSIVSGKGGVGKTFISTSMALLSAHQGKRVLLIDGDLSLANVDIVMGVRTKYHLGDVIDGTVTFHEAVVPGPGGVFVLPASAGLSNLASISVEQQRRILDTLAPQLAIFDVVIIDCGAGVGDNVVFFGRAAGEVLLVLTPEPTALADAYATIKVLHHEAGIDVVDVVVNQAGESIGRDVFKRLSGVVGRFLNVRLRFRGSVPLDDAVRHAVLAQRPLVTAQPAAPAAQTMTVFTRNWLTEQTEPRAGLLETQR